MIPIDPKIRALIKVHGGKTYLVRDLILMMPNHDDYLSAFGGGGPDVLNRPRSEIEIFNDVDYLTANVFYCVVNNASEMCTRISDIPYDEQVFQLCKELLHSAGNTSGVLGDIRLAVATIVASRFSRGGMGEAFAWSDRLRGGQPGDVNAWETYKLDLPRICERAAGVIVLCEDGPNLIKKMAHAAATANRRLMIYADPPYLHSTRISTAVYRTEKGMSKAERKAKSIDLHTRTIHAAQYAHDRGAFVMLSGYHNEMYSAELRLAEFGTPWRVREFELANHSGQGAAKQRRTEVVYYNFELPADALK